MLSFVSKGCTQVLDATILAERIRYASTRDDFHTVFDMLTVPRIQKLLRGEAPSTRWYDEPRHLGNTLIEAQEERPDTLWELLLLQAFETTLVARRLAISAVECPALDQLVRRTFLEALVDLPYCEEPEQKRRLFLNRSAQALAKAIRAPGMQLKIARARHAARRPAADVTTQGNKTPSEVG